MSEVNFNEKQIHQENAFKFPYHWLINRNSTKGRLYFGYLDLCVEKIGNNSKDLKILDAGCGDGRFIGYLNELGYKNLYGADYSQRALEFSRLLVPEADFKFQNLEESLNYENNSFDIIFLIETLEHIKPDKIKTLLNNLKSGLKPGGKLIITVPSVLLETGPKHYQHFTEESLSDILSQTFTSINIIGQYYIGFHLIKLFFKLFDNRFYSIKPIERWYNLKIWPRFFNKCKVKKAGRLIAVCENKYSKYEKSF